MSCGFRLFLEDILEGCGKDLRFTAEMSFEQFVVDEKTYGAVVRNLEIIGEAAKNVSEHVRLRHSDVKMISAKKIGFSFKTSSPWSLANQKN